MGHLIRTRCMLCVSGMHNGPLEQVLMSILSRLQLFRVITYPQLRQLRQDCRSIHFRQHMHEYGWSLSKIDRGVCLFVHELMCTSYLVGGNSLGGVHTTGSTIFADVLGGFLQMVLGYRRFHYIYLRILYGVPGFFYKRYLWSYVHLPAETCTTRRGCY